MVLILAKLRLSLVLALLFPSVVIQAQPNPEVSYKPIALPQVVAPQFPDSSQNYQQTIVIPAKTACEARGGTLNGLDCELPPPAPIQPQPAFKPLQISANPTSFQGLMGTIGYALAGGNCVNEPGVNNPHNGTNPISWPVLTQTPTIGATVLFYFNHTGVITGIWGNGDIEIRHQNCPGCPHRYPRGMFRGFR